MLNVILIYLCSRCGATLSHKMAQRIEAEKVCPICHNQYAGFRDNKLKKIADDFANIPSKLGLEVDAVYVDNNNVGNPRLIVRFSDNYFNDYKNLKLPNGFEIKCTRDDSHQSRPIEMVYTFDVNDITMVDGMPMEIALDEVLRNLEKWIRDFNR